jgi:hypothetical protein
VAVEQPLGLTLTIMRDRSFARTWAEFKRPRGEGEPPPSGALVAWCQRIQTLRDEAELLRIMNEDPALTVSLAMSDTRQPDPA